MIGTLGVWEMMALLVLALIVFGPRRLPEIGRSLGKAVSAFRRASFEFRDTLDREVMNERRALEQPPQADAAGPEGPPPSATGQSEPHQPAEDAEPRS